MCNILAIINQKGGVGKTSVTFNLGSVLMDRGKKVLFIDTDQQCNLTGYMQLNKEFPNFLDIMTESKKIKECIQTQGNLTGIASSYHLSNLENKKKSKILTNALESIKKDYDFIVIDTPPQLSTITINALVASTSIIIPAEASLFALEGIQQLYNNIEDMREITGLPLKIEGIILNRYKNRTIITQEFTELLKKACEVMKTKVFKATLRDSVMMVEMQAHRQSIIEYAPQSVLADDYNNFVNELLESI